MSTVIIPRPEKLRGRSTFRHWTSGRAAGAGLPARLILYVGSHDPTRDDWTTARFWSRAVASAASVESVGGSKGNGVGTWEETTMRAVVPTRRAST